MSDKIERAVLGCMYDSEAARLKIIDKLTVADFATLEAKKLFEIIHRMHLAKKPIEMMLVCAEIHDPALEAYCVDCAENAFSSVSLDGYIETLRDNTTRRNLQDLSMLLSEMTKTDSLPVDEIINNLSNGFMKITDKRVDAVDYDHYTSVCNFYEYVEKGLRNDKKIPGLRSPWQNMDYMTNGFQQGKVYVLGGLKKTGKTRFLMNLISAFLQDNEPGVMFSMEMQEKDLHACIIACRAGIDTADFGTAHIVNRDMEKLLDHVPTYAQENFYVSRKSAITPEFVRTVIRSRKQRQPVKWVAIDYIQRMTARGIHGKTDAMEYCATQLADIARDENVAMIELSQLSGEAETNKSDAPIYSLIKNSQAIIEAADVAIILNDPNRGKDVAAADGSKEITALLLQRSGISDRWLRFRADLKYSRFVEDNSPKKDLPDEKGRNKGTQAAASKSNQGTK
jgi:replicative DNA helicase